MRFIPIRVQYRLVETGLRGVRARGSLLEARECLLPPFSPRFSAELKEFADRIKRFSVPNE